MLRLIVVGALFGALILALANPAGASRSGSYTLPMKKALNEYSRQWHATHHQCGRCAGRNIRRWGVKMPSGKTRKPSAAEVGGSTPRLRALRLPRLAPRPPRVPPSNVMTARAPAGGTLGAIRACESGGRYSTNTGNGFYGAYQFTQSTWASVGGAGNPANASPAEQDKRAAMLYAREGAAPWPVCGR